MREKGLQSLHYFNDEILRYAYPPYNMSSAIHKEMDEWLETIFSSPEMFSLMLDARGYGKSLRGGVGHTLWRGVRNPNITVRYMHSDESMAAEIMGQMRGHLESNEIFRALYSNEIAAPGGLPQKYSDEIFTLNRTFAPRTPTLRMLGYKTGRIGTHVDMFVLDDLVNNKTSQTQLLVESVKDFIRQLTPLMNDPERSRVLALGTRWDVSDAWGMLLEDDAYRGHVRPWVKSCYADPEETISRWPEKYTPEVLKAAESKMGKWLFSANMRNEPIPRGSQKFDVTKVKRFELKLDDKMRPVLPNGNNYLIYTAVDPNRKDDGTGDPAAVLTIARDNEGNHFVLDLEYGRPNSIEMVLWIRQAFEKWKSIAVFYEAICGQEMLIPWIKQDMIQSGITYPLQKSTRRMGASKIVRILALSHIIETGRLWVPNSVRFKPLLREIELYTGQNKFPKDDCLDCLADIYLDGFDASGGVKKRKERDLDMPWQTPLMDAMISTYGGHRPKVTSVESGQWR